MAEKDDGEDRHAVFRKGQLGVGAEVVRGGPEAVFHSVDLVGCCQEEEDNTVPLYTKAMIPAKVSIALRGVETILSFDSATVEETDVRLILHDAEGELIGQFFLDSIAGWWFDPMPS
jgi:hypothetical protein